MFKKLTLPTIKKYFSKEVFLRGEKYYKNDNVLEVVEKGNKLFSVVKGSDFNRYNVTIAIDEHGYFSELECNCLYWDNCKHIVAVLIYYLKHGPHKIDELENPLLTKERQVEKQDTVHNDIVITAADLERSSLQYDSEFNIFHFDRFNFKVDQSSADRKKLGFSIVPIKRDKFSPVYDWSIIPVNIHVKKDGEYGRITSYQSDAITEPVGNTDMVMIKRLSDKEFYTDDFTYYIDFLLSENESRFFVKYEKLYFPLRLSRIKTITMRFKLSRLFIDKKDVLFFPDIEFYMENGDVISNQNVLGVPIFFGDVFLFVCKDGNVVYLKDTSNVLFFLKKIVMLSKALRISDINYLKEYIAEHSLDSFISISFKFKELKILADDPGFIIELSEKMDNAYISFFLEYNDRLIPYFYDTKLLKISEDLEKGEVFLVQRNKKIEEEILAYLFDRLKTVVTSYDYIEGKENQRRYVLQSSIRDFLVTFGDDLLNEGFDIKIDKSDNRLSKNAGTISLFVESGIDWFDLKTLYIDRQGEQIPIRPDDLDLKNGILKRRGDLVLLSKDDIATLQKLVEEGLDKKGSLKVSKYNLPVIEELYESIANPENEDLITAREISEKFKNFDGIEQEALPNRFNGTLRNYQVAGYYWLSFLHKYDINGCLADDMGLGKTVQTLALIQKLKESGQLRNILIIVPVTTIYNWENEIKQFTPQISCLSHFGNYRNKDGDFIKEHELIITSYHTLRNDIKIIKDIEFDYIILDEAQNIKNADTKIYKAIKILKAKNRLSLTGTPIENNTLELWAQMNFLNPGLLGSLAEFKRKYAKDIESKANSDQAEKLKKIIYPFLLRRKKEEVLKDLPEKEEISLYIEMKKEQAEFYHELKEKYRYEISKLVEHKGVKQNTIKIFEALLRLRQAVLFPGLVDNKYRDIESCKLLELKRMIEEVISEDHKMLIFSQFVQCLSIIRAYVEDEGIKYSYIDGSTRRRDRQIAQFQENDDIKLFLLSLKAGATGINLTSADYVVIFDPWWNPAIEKQAMDRAHRIGQVKKVIVYKMIVKDSIEEKIVSLQEKKKMLVSQLITEDVGVFKSLSDKDVLGLFE